MTRLPSVALAGFGTIGAGPLKVPRDNADIAATRAGWPTTITAVSAQDRNKDRGVPVSRRRPSPTGNGTKFPHAGSNVVEPAENEVTAK